MRWRIETGGRVGNQFGCDENVYIYKYYTIKVYGDRKTYILKCRNPLERIVFVHTLTRHSIKRQIRLNQTGIPSADEKKKK